MYKHRWLGVNGGGRVIYDQLGGVLGVPMSVSDSSYADGIAGTGVTFGVSSIMPGDSTTACSFDGTANGIITGPTTNSNVDMPSQSSYMIRIAGLDTFPAGTTNNQEITLWERFTNAVTPNLGFRVRARWVSASSKWFLRVLVDGSDGASLACTRAVISQVGFSAGTTHWEVRYNKNDGVCNFYANGEYLGQAAKVDSNFGSITTFDAGATTPWTIGYSLSTGNNVVSGHVMQWRDVWHNDTGGWAVSAQTQRTLSTLFLTSADNLAPNPPTTKRDVWFDDDGSDWDGYAALNLLAIWHNLGYVNLIGVSQTTTETYACGASRAVLDSHGLYSIPVSHFKGSTTGLPSDSVGYVGVTTSTYLNGASASLVGLSNSSYPDMVTTFQTAITSSTDGHVCVVCNGQGRGIAAARAGSGAPDLARWRAKVMCVTVSSIQNNIVLNAATTGGSVTDSSVSGSTYNFNQDAVAWNAFIPNLATDSIPLETTDVNVGGIFSPNVATCGSDVLPLVASAPTNPLSKIRQLANSFIGASEGDPRNAWDSYATYVAVFGSNGLMSEIAGAFGTHTVNSALNTPNTGALGYNKFTPLSGGIDQLTTMTLDYFNGSPAYNSFKIFLDSFVAGTNSSLAAPQFLSATATLPSLSFSSVTNKSITMVLHADMNVTGTSGGGEVHLLDPAGIDFTSDIVDFGITSGDGTQNLTFACTSNLSNPISNNRATGYIDYGFAYNWTYIYTPNYLEVPNLTWSATTLSINGVAQTGSAMNMIANGYLWRKFVAAGNGQITLTPSGGTGGDVSAAINLNVYNGSNSDFELVGDSLAGSSVTVNVTEGSTYFVLVHRTSSGTVTSPNFSLTGSFVPAEVTNDSGDGSAPDSDNYKIGGARIYVKRVGQDGYFCLGNAYGISLPANFETLDHFTSFAGTRQKDRIELTAESYEFNFTLDEMTTSNLRFALRGDEITYSQQDSDNEVLLNFDAPAPGLGYKTNYFNFDPNGPVSGGGGGTYNNGSGDIDLVPYDSINGTGNMIVDYELGIITFPVGSGVEEGADIELSFDLGPQDLGQDFTAIASFDPGTLRGIQEIDGFIIAFEDNKGGILEWTGVYGVLSSNGAISLNDTDWSNIQMKISVLASEDETAPFGTFRKF